MGEERAQIGHIIHVNSRKPTKYQVTNKSSLPRASRSTKGSTREFVPGYFSIPTIDKLPSSFDSRVQSIRWMGSLSSVRGHSLEPCRPRRKWLRPESP
jgi:hypothetical protein